MRKYIIGLLLFLAYTAALVAQPCYSTFREAGIAAYQRFEFERAIRQFEAAQICDDQPTQTDIEDWLSKARNGYIDRLKGVAARYLGSEAQRAHEAYAHGLAFRLSQEATRIDSTFLPPSELQAQLLSYLAPFQGTIPSTLHHLPLSDFLLQDQLLVFSEKPVTRMRLYALDTQQKTWEVELAGQILNIAKSADDQWLLVETMSSSSKRFLTLYRARDGEKVRAFADFDAFSTQFNFTADNQRLFFNFIARLEKEESRSIFCIYDIPSNSLVYQDTARQIFISKTENNRPLQRKIKELSALDQAFFQNIERFATHHTQFVRTGDDALGLESKMKYLSANGEIIATTGFDGSGSNSNFSTSFGSNDDQGLFSSTTYNSAYKWNFYNWKTGEKQDIYRFTPSTSIRSENNEKYLPFAFVPERNWQINIHEHKSVGFGLENKTQVFTSCDLVIKEIWTDSTLYTFDDVYDFRLLKDRYLFFISNGTYNKRYLSVFDVQKGELLATTSFFDKISKSFPYAFDVQWYDQQIWLSVLNPADEMVQSGEREMTIFQWQFLADTLYEHRLPFATDYARVHPSTGLLAYLQGNKKVLRIKKINEDKELGKIVFLNPIAEIQFSKDGKYLLARDVNGLTKLLPTKNLRDAASYYDKTLPLLSVEQLKTYGIDWKTD